MFCKNCGSQINDSADFCPNCGNKNERKLINGKRTSNKTHIIMPNIKIIIGVLVVVGIVFVGKLLFFNHDKDGFADITLAKDATDIEDLQSITLGKWNNESVEWLVLDKKDGKLLLMSKYIIDSQKYHDEGGNITWESCSLRKWLNETFYNLAFDENEKNIISESVIINDEESAYVAKGNNTKDKVFLLSEGEVKKYLKKRLRLASGTSYIKKKLDFYVSFYDDSDAYWLRSPGVSESNADIIIPGGGIDDTFVMQSGIGIRPVIWIKYK